MTLMLSPDLLDRRALALLALTDGYGRPLEGPVALAGDGVRFVGKRGGQIVILDAPGFAEYTATFADPPASPAVRSKTLTIDLTPADPAVLPRRVALKLPRDPDPAKKTDPRSLFQAEAIRFSASSRVRAEGNACVLRASVTRQGDGLFVENALVRAKSADGKHEAWGLTDAAGEAALVFAALPISFTGAGGTPSPTIDCQVVVHADAATARFADAATLSAARRAAASRREGHADPDAIAAQAPNFAAGQTIQLSAGSQPAVALQWDTP